MLKQELAMHTNLMGYLAKQADTMQASHKLELRDILFLWYEPTNSKSVVASMISH